MAQLRQDYPQFVGRDMEVVVVGPEDARAFAAYWQKESLPFIGLPDSTHSVLKLGRMPAQVLIDKAGVARFVHYGHGMSEFSAGAGGRSVRHSIRTDHARLPRAAWTTSIDTGPGPVSCKDSGARRAG